MRNKHYTQINQKTLLKKPFPDPSKDGHRQAKDEKWRNTGMHLESNIQQLIWSFNSIYSELKK